ncbi:hypothetical protein SDC9_173386 [bioreactor metagenome]|uniref:Uncharacterized protein n=1 Tax=bioreactor metagenome TaxID=1076179 RepID=A0A645GPT3_9ZZZZ
MAKCGVPRNVQKADRCLPLCQRDAVYLLGILAHHIAHHTGHHAPLHARLPQQSTVCTVQLNIDDRVVKMGFKLHGNLLCRQPTVQQRLFRELLQLPDMFLIRFAAVI